MNKGRKVYGSSRYHNTVDAIRENGFSVSVIRKNLLKTNNEFSVPNGKITGNLTDRKVDFLFVDTDSARNIQEYHAQILEVREEKVIANYLVDEEEKIYQKRSIDIEVLEGLDLSVNGVIKITITTFSDNKRLFEYEVEEDSKVVQSKFEPIEEYLPNYEQYKDLMGA